MKNTLLEESKKYFNSEPSNLTLDDLLDEIAVMPVDDLDNHDGNPMLEGWYAVATDQGILAYFGQEEDALGFRLNYINLILNF